MRQDFIKNETMARQEGRYVSPSVCVISLKTDCAILTDSTIYNTDPAEMGEQNVF